MKDKQIKDPLLVEAKYYRDSRLFPEALATLHQLSNKYPENVSLIYLLASTYYESRSEDEALKYCDMAIEKDENSKEAYELKGILLKRKGEYADSEKNLLKSLALDANMHDARKHLIALYYFYLKDYPKAEEHCVYMFQHRDPDRDNMSRRGKIKAFDWILLISNMYRSSLIRQKKYKEAAENLKYKISFGLSITYDPSIYLSDHANLYNLYCISGDEENRKEQYEYLRNFYKVSEAEIKGWEDSLKEDGYVSVMTTETPIMYGL
jgi:tetratricopeptide (TPR) repeat protein